jgi:hypothetical protein
MSGVVAGLVGSLKAVVAAAISFFVIRFNNTETGIRARTATLIGYDKSTSSVFHLQPTYNASNFYADSWRLISRNYNTGVINWVKKITPDGNFFGVDSYPYNFNMFPYSLGIRNSKIFVGMTDYYNWRIVGFNLDGTVFASKEFASSVTSSTATIDNSFNVFIPVFDNTWEVGKGSSASTTSLVAYNLVTGTKVSNTASPQNGVANSRSSFSTAPVFNASGDRLWSDSYYNEYGTNIFKIYLLRNGSSQAIDVFLQNAAHELTDTSLVKYRRVDYTIKIDGSFVTFPRFLVQQCEFSKSNLTTGDYYFAIFSFVEGVPTSGTSLIIRIDGDYGYVIHNRSFYTNTIYLAKINLKTGQIYWQKKLTLTLTFGNSPYFYDVILDPNKNLVFSASMSANSADSRYSLIDYAVFNSDGSNMTGTKTFGSYVFAFTDFNFITLYSISTSLNQAIGSNPVSMRTPAANLTVSDYSKIPQLVDKTSVYTETKETI